LKAKQVPYKNIRNRGIPMKTIVLTCIILALISGTFSVKAEDPQSDYQVCNKEKALNYGQKLLSEQSEAGEFWYFIRLVYELEKCKITLKELLPNNPEVLLKIRNHTLKKDSQNKDLFERAYPNKHERSKWKKLIFD
jgi:hypothetical protein